MLGEPAILAVLASTLTLAGAGAVALGWLWDRSRGRARCPRCWYPLEGPGVCCPECGRAVRSARDLHRTRRKLPLVGAGLVVSVIGVVLLSSRPQPGWLWRRAPTGLLLRVLPGADKAAWEALRLRPGVLIAPENSPRLLLVCAETLRANGDAQSRLAAVLLAGELGLRGALGAANILGTALTDGDTDVARAAAELLPRLRAAGFSTGEIAMDLIAAMEHQDEWVAFHAARSLDPADVPCDAAERLAALYGRPSGAVQLKVSIALNEMAERGCDMTAAAALLEFIADSGLVDAETAASAGRLAGELRGASSGNGTP